MTTTTTTTTIDAASNAKAIRRRLEKRAAAVLRAIEEFNTAAYAAEVDICLDDAEDAVKEIVADMDLAIRETVAARN